MADDSKYNGVADNIGDKFSKWSFEAKFSTLSSVLFILLLNASLIRDGYGMKLTHKNILLKDSTKIAQNADLINQAEAAENSLMILPQSQTYSVGSELKLNVFLNTGDEQINAAEIVLDYPTDKLKLKETNVNYQTFDVQVDEPQESGKVKITVGSTKPQSGSINVANVVFETVKKGQANVIFNPVTKVLSSETNTNILQNTSDTKYIIQ